jgi:multicomponent Na+:H+ antiporter subunit D
MTDAQLLIAPVLLPFVAAIVALFVRERAALVRAVSVAASLALVVVSVLLMLQTEGGARLPATTFGGWPGGFGISFTAAMPGVALVMVTAVIALSATLYGLSDIGARRRRAGYDALMLALVGAVNGAFLTHDLFNLYVWFELALVAAVALLTIDRRPAQIDGAIRYAGFAMLAATFILIGVVMIYGVTGTLDVAAAGAALSGRPPTFATAVAAALLFAGFALKAGLFPFHLWLPASYHPAPTTVLAVFAGLLTKVGFYALLLVFAGLFGFASGGVGASQLKPLFGVMAAATMLVCVLGALAQTDMRRLLGYHIIAQVGYMMMGLSLDTREGVAAAVFYMVHSIIVQANLFLGAGLIRRASGSWDLTRTGGIARAHPLFAILFAIPVLSLAGIPPFSGFWAKLLVIRESFDADMAWLGVAALAAGMLTIVSMGLFWSDACWKSPRRGRVHSIPASGIAAMALLSGATVALGLAPQWLWTIAQLSAGALGRMAQRGGP